MLKNSKGYGFSLLKKPKSLQEINNTVIQALGSSLIMYTVTQN